MQVTSMVKDGCKIIHLIGELDECSAEYVRKTIDKSLMDKNYSYVLFDMKDLKFMDSTGIGVLLGRYKILKKMGINVCIGNCNKQIDRILSMSGIYNIMQKIS